MKYVIWENKKCRFIDDDRKRLVDTLKFVPQYKESDIMAVTDNAVEQAYTGEWWAKGYAPIRPDEETKELRAHAYLVEVDPLTAHIQRLRDSEDITPEIEAKINELMAERQQKINEIKTKYPYNEEN